MGIHEIMGQRTKLFGIRQILEVAAARAPDLAASINECISDLDAMSNSLGDQMKTATLPVVAAKAKGKASRAPRAARKTATVLAFTQTGASGVAAGAAATPQQTLLNS